MSLGYIWWHTFFPAGQHEQRLADCDVADFKQRYCPVQHSGVVSLLPYQDPIVQAAIALNKFHHHPKAQNLLALVLSDYLATQPDSSVLVPIPLHWYRHTTRGYNQVTEILKQVTTDHQQAPKLLCRVRPTRAQTSLTRQSRLENMRQAFAVRTSVLKHVPEEASLLLVDDVLTTGATMVAARAALAQHTSLPIHCVALAH